MDNKTNNPNEEQTRRLQQPAVGGSLPPAQQFREWEADAIKAMEVFKANGMEYSKLCSEAMANAYRRCAELLERQCSEAMANAYRRCAELLERQ